MKWIKEKYRLADKKIVMIGKSYSKNVNRTTFEEQPNYWQSRGNFNTDKNEKR